MKNHHISLSPQSHQSGAALITGLIFLVVLTMIGITSARMSTLEERMSGNMRDRSIAMQAAERALRDAERDILGAVPAAARNLSGLTGFVADCGASTAGNTADDGLCYNGTAGYANPIWSAVNMTAAPSVAYGRFTNAANIAGLSAQPRYVLEGIRRTPPGGGQIFYYRIMARAQGVNANTVVWLEEVFSP
jgi:type IV pilus assembly protein PilX